MSWLEVYPGLVSRPGTSLWGEIVDIRELDVRCEVTSEQADEVSLGEPVELRTSDGKRALPLGHVIYIAPVADPKTKQVPILVRIHNRDQRVRCGISVAMRFAPFGVDNKKGLANRERRQKASDRASRCCRKPRRVAFPVDAFELAVQGPASVCPRAPSLPAGRESDRACGHPRR